MNWQSFTVPRRAAVWLVYLGILVFQPALDPSATWREWALIPLLLVVFLPLYGWTIRNSSSRPFLWRSGQGGGPGAVLGICVIIALGIGATPLNSGASVFFVYAAAAAGIIRPRKASFALMAAAFLAVPVAALISTVPRQVVLIAFLPAAVFVPITGLGNFYEREREHSNARLRMAHDEIERLATIAERERIARDLHDLLGHTLSTITLKSELAARIAHKDPVRAENEMRDVERISREALGQVRAAVRGYRSGGLEGELANVRLALEAAQIEYDYFYEGLALPPAIEGVVALAVREGVTNVVRHANASQCQVLVEREGDEVVLTIEDDGDWQPGLRGDAAPVTGGLSIMRSRVEALGGDLDIGRTGQGERGRTRLQLRLPLPLAAPALAAS
ncbi:MAG TPA: sensor histidine kinase [Trueperaceae bacterium]|nr:sensor histidine kinase [Trueperaceae bacterium]